MAIDLEQLKDFFESFAGQRVLVIGDVMLDAYLFGNVERISPEAPVPVVAVNKRESRLGGAGNVGLNLRSLGAETILCSVIGDDERGRELKQLMLDAGLDAGGMIKSESRVTTTKFRVIGNNVQMLRVDEETTEDLNETDYNRLRERIQYFFNEQQVSSVIFQDYDKGVVSPELIDFVVDLAKKKDIPILVDPKKKNFLNYKGVTLIKPNLKELAEGLGIDIDASKRESLQEAAGMLRSMLQADMILNTLSEKGVYVIWEEDKKLQDAVIPAFLRNISDVSGAGDTVISVAALGLAYGLSPEDMALLSNLAGGLVCEDVGVVPVNKDKFFEEAESYLKQVQG